LTVLKAEIMLKNGKRIRRRRVFTEDFKLKIVKSYESGEYSVPELEKIYDINNMSIYKWIYRYSNYNEKNVKVVEMKDSQYKKIKDLEERNKELERALGQKQMSLDYLEKMIELAKERYNIDIKKNSNTPQSGGSKTTKKN